MATLNPKTWPRWAWLLIAAAAVLPVLIGARALGAWPFGGPDGPKVGDGSVK